MQNYNYVGAGREDDNKKGEYTAIFYNRAKFACVTTKTFWLSTNPDSVSIGWDAVLPRICKFGSFKNIRTQDTLNVFNYHFDHKGKEAKKMSAKLILNKILELDLLNRPVIVLGDLNCEPFEEPIKILERTLNDSLNISDR